MIKIKSHFHDTIPTMIVKHKRMIEECLKIMGDKIKGDLSDDKMHNVIKSKRMAAETVEWSSKEIDRLGSILDGTADDEELGITNFSERMAK